MRLAGVRDRLSGFGASARYQKTNPESLRQCMFLTTSGKKLATFHVHKSCKGLAAMEYDEFEAVLSQIEVPPLPVDRELDLRGLNRARAMSKLYQMLDRGPFGQDGVLRIRIDAASATSGETLFQPVAKLLLNALRRNVLSCCYLLPREVGAGFCVRFRAFANREQTA